MSRWRDRLDVVVVAATLLVVTIAFGVYLEHRQAVADARGEKQRTAICSILAALPPSPPPSLQAARAVFARPGHPRDCRPVVRPRASSVPRATPSPEPASPQILLVPSNTAAASPRPTARTRPSSTPTTRPNSPSPSPKPSPTCVGTVLTVCLSPR